MSDEKERQESGRVTERVTERYDSGEPDFEGHGSDDGDEVSERRDSEPDFEGHRFADKQTEKQTEKQTD